MWTFRDPRTGRFRACRLSPASVDAFYSDPITAECGCADEIVNEWRKRDLRDGCPRCRADVVENASEPDVLRRWGLR